MRFVRGRTLRRAIAEYHAERQAGRSDPLTLQDLLLTLVSVGHAIAYAHSRGVIHRDLKPENVILGGFGAVIVLDWGLAKMVGRPDEPEDLPGVQLGEEAGGEITQAGQQLGTPAYMAPEQAEGRLDLIDERTDVYGLGSILFEVLTGRSPHHGANTHEVLRQIIEGQTPRARLIDAAIAPALEAICLRAMAKDRADRYAGAGAMVEDLQRWLADEPVSVHRETIPTRVGRWMRRHRTGVVAASAVILVTLIGLGAVATVQARANRELKRVNGDLLISNGRERTARSQAEERFSLARDAIEAYYTGVSQDVLLKQPQLEDLRKMLLGSALGFYEKLQGVLEAEPGRKALVELASAYDRMGEINREIGSRPAARQAFGARGRSTNDWQAMTPAPPRIKPPWPRPGVVAARSRARRASRRRRGRRSKRPGRSTNDWCAITRMIRNTGAAWPPPRATWALC